MLEVLPPVITNYKEGEGFDAFLGGDALDIKFCNIAKKEALIYKGYCTARSGEILELILSVPAFRHYFNITEDEYKNYLHHLEKNGLN